MAQLESRFLFLQIEDDSLPLSTMWQKQEQIMNKSEFTTGLRLLTENYSTVGKAAGFTTGQEDIFWEAFKDVTGDAWRLMIRSIIETQTYLPRTNAFYKAKNDIGQGDGLIERVRVECNLCDGE